MKTLVYTLFFCLFKIHGFSQTVEFKIKSQSFPAVINGAAAWGDFNNDGFYDLAICGNTGANDAPVLLLKVFKNNKDSTFTEIASTFAGIYEGEIKWADFNNDGWLDLLACGATSFDATFSEYTPGILLYKNNGNETFTKITNTGLDSLSLSSIDVADVNKDGKVDVVLSGLNASSSDVTRVYRNHGDFSFSLLSSLDGLHHSKVKFGSYNGDAYPDIIVSGFVNSSDPKTYVYKNNCDETFTKIPTSMTGVAYGDIVWADFNNDGLDDVFFSGSNSGVTKKMYQNNYPNSFTDVTEADLLAAFHSTVDANDFDLDGDLDLMIIGSNGSTAKTEIYLNDGSFSFSKDPIVLPGMVHPLFASADVNNDGKIDFIISGPPTDNGTKVTNLYINKSQNTNSAPGIPVNVKYSQNWDQVTITWDKVTDTQGNSNTITYNVYIGTTPGSKDVLNPSVNILSGQLLTLCNGNNMYSDTLKLTLGGGFYYCGVQAIDNNFMASPFSTEMYMPVAFVSVEKKGMIPFSINYNRNTNKIIINYSVQNNSDISVDIFNMYGKIIYRKNCVRNSDYISTSGWSKGIYIFRFNNQYSKMLLIE